jgi:hypothetical protein
VRWAAINELSLEFSVPECGGGGEVEYYIDDPATEPTAAGASAGCTSIQQDPSGAKKIKILARYIPPPARRTGPLYAQLFVSVYAGTRWRCGSSLLSYGMGMSGAGIPAVNDFNFGPLTARRPLSGVFYYGLFAGITDYLQGQWASGESSAYYDVTISAPQ